MKRQLKKVMLAGGLALCLAGGFPQAHAMGRFDALSLIESGNDDHAIGRAGEVSRFQIKPAVWVRYCREYSVSQRTNPKAALAAAQAIMRERCGEFKRRYGRPPTDFEYYVLWNAPAQIDRPKKSVAERAQRFSNLVNS